MTPPDMPLSENQSNTQTTDPRSIYEQIGTAGFERLVAAFYRRVAADPILRPLYPEQDLSGAERRLRLFLIQYFGGPTLYAQERGHPRLRLRHEPFQIGQAARDAWMTAMLGAMQDAGITGAVYAEMHAYFERGATFMINVREAD